MNDKPLVTEYLTGNKKAASEELFNKYEQLVYKQMGKINNALSKVNLPGFTIEEYKSEAWDTMIKALDSIDLSKVKDDFGFYCRYNQYLMSRNRDMINAFLKNAKHTTSMIKYNGETEYNVLDVEQAESNANCVFDSFYQNEQSKIIRQAINNVLARCTPAQRTVLTAFEDGDKSSLVKQKLNISQSEYSKLVRQVRTSLKDEIILLQKGTGIKVM